MKYIILFIYLFIVINSNVCAQYITSLSQKSNYFISTDSYGLTWISSTDGVNVYNGLDVRVYRPGLYNMIGNNVQSLFFEDCAHNMWFTTYNALNCYIREKDDFAVYQFRDSLGQIIDDSYKVFAYNDQFVLLRYGDFLGLFDINTNQISRAWDFKLAQFNYFDASFTQHKINVVACLQNRISIINSSNILIGKPNQTNITLDNNQSLASIQIKNEHQILLTYYKKTYIDVYDLVTKINEKFYEDTSPINYSKYIPTSNELLICDTKQLKLYSLTDHKVKETWTYPNNVIGNPAPINLSDDIIYLCIDGKGILIYHKNKHKMEHLSLDEDNLPANVRAIIRSGDGTYWYGSRDRGIGHFDKDGRDLGHYNKDNNTCPSNFIMAVAQLKNNEILGAGGRDVVKYQKSNDRFVSVKNTNKNQDHFIGGFAMINGEALLVVDYSNFHFLHRMVFNSDNTYTLSPINVKGGKIDDEYVYVYNLNQQEYIVGINSTEVALLRYVDGKGEILKRHQINNSPNDIYIQRDSVYLPTDGGLYVVHKNFDQQPRKVIDAEGKLNQNIYCALIYNEKFFISTNDGLMMYTPANNLVHQFTKADGIQDMEYNSLAAHKADDGTMIFGGVNGINIFHPDSIRFLDDPAKIHISKLLINDENHPSYIHANGLESLQLPFSENTLSFFFNGIDYADQSAIKLKYQMHNYDKHPVLIDKNDGFARYTNLPPGDYEFLIFATNSDGIWNKTPRTVKITVDPPYWRTWWFRLLVLAAAFGSGYSLVRSRYKRKLEKQNQLLREQALIIEKQQGIEAERARIASEMHDDLGSGLTTIRFLSERALKSVNTETEINEIRKIANQSNALVSNMSEIIWALNARLDNSDELSAYLRRYVGEYLGEHGIGHQFESTGELDTNVLTGEKRRNIFLVIKEILHNTVKYSGAKAVDVQLVFQGEKINITITEIDGLGFDFDEKIGTGNGLYNIQKRMDKINGEIKYIRTDNGMKIIINIPVEHE